MRKHGEKQSETEKLDPNSDKKLNLDSIIYCKWEELS